ncbi:hypothetical protein [Paraprevotella xylaniphila]|uniref:hypothetical protein n=1 Tax=Paraprevotella xylaniphila TaxID=454155 RepID=UPI00266C8895|nr:hypothetical protein [Paraprevotella xylaniphila]
MAGRNLRGLHLFQGGREGFLDTSFYHSALFFTYFKQKGEPFSAKRFFVWRKKHFFSPHVVRIFSACRSETGLKASHDLPESLIFSSV